MTVENVWNFYYTLLCKGKIPQIRKESLIISNNFLFIRPWFGVEWKPNQKPNRFIKKTLKRRTIPTFRKIKISLLPAFITMKERRWLTNQGIVCTFSFQYFLIGLVERRDSLLFYNFKEFYLNCKQNVFIDKEMKGK